MWKGETRMDVWNRVEWMEGPYEKRQERRRFTVGPKFLVKLV